VFIPLKQKQPDVIEAKSVGWMFHFSNTFLGHKVPDRERLVSWSIVMEEDPIVGPKFRPFYTPSVFPHNEFG
jgi:hypothetical protein